MIRIRDIEKQIKLLKCESQLLRNELNLLHDKREMMSNIKQKLTSLLPYGDYRNRINVSFHNCKNFDDCSLCHDVGNSKIPILYLDEGDSGNILCNEYNRISKKYNLGWQLTVSRIGMDTWKDVRNFTDKLFENAFIPVN